MKAKTVYSTVVEVDSVKLSQANEQEVAEWCNGTPVGSSEPSGESSGLGIMLYTRKGYQRAHCGDVIIKKGKADFLVCSAELFDLVFGDPEQISERMLWQAEAVIKIDGLTDSDYESLVRLEQEVERVDEHMNVHSDSHGMGYGALDLQWNFKTVSAAIDFRLLLHERLPELDFDSYLTKVTGTLLLAGHRVNSMVVVAEAKGMKRWENGVCRDL